jgi:hypothetical protein
LPIAPENFEILMKLLSISDLMVSNVKDAEPEKIKSKLVPSCGRKN